jgi:microcystin-dependent protein
VVFSNEKLQAVPYAIFAQNGVPTGSIMPFIGTVAPNGWLLCNGSSFASLDVAITANLKALLGGSTNTPDLKGIFLRGIGRQCNAYGCYEGPELKAIQQDDLKSHAHAISIPTTSNGSHSHSITRRSNPNNSAYDGGDSKQDENSASTTDRDDLGTFATSSNGNHTHTENGNSNSTGGSETRPINYGVNYIIKI